VQVGEAAKMVKEWMKGKSANVEAGVYGEGSEVTAASEFKIKVDEGDVADDIQDKIAYMLFAAIQGAIKKVLAANGAKPDVAGKVARWAEKSANGLAGTVAEDAARTNLYNRILKG